MLRNIDGDRALVTGASSGIGYATARALASEGVDVAVTARREERLWELAEEITDAYGTEVLVEPADIQEQDAVKELVDRAVSAFGGFDVVVNNAGVAISGHVKEQPMEEYETMMATNVDGTFYVTRATLPYLKESEGTLVFIGSFGGQYPRPKTAVYAATKWWTRGFAQSVQADVGDDGVGVSLVNPTEVRTELGSESGKSMQEYFDSGEITAPEEVAEAIVFAARQRGTSTVSSMDLYRRDKLSSIF